MPNIQSVLENQAQEPVVFSCLNTLIRAVGLEYLLQGQHPLTLFAPVDRAFEAFGSGGVYDFLKDLDKLTLLLQYHLVPLVLTTNDLRGLAQDEKGIVELPTYANHPLTINLTEGFTVNGYRVPRANVMAENGVIHMLDDVLWPAGLAYKDFGTRSPASEAVGYEVDGATFR